MDSQATFKYLQSIVRDTPVEMLQKQQEFWVANAPEKRLMLTLDHMSMCRQIFENGIKNRNPQWTEEEIELEAFRITYKDFYSDDELKKIMYSIKEYRKNKTLKADNE